MKKILYIAYHFPPVGGGGVQRSLKFVKYLPEFGYQPTVLTAHPPGERRWTPVDRDLCNEIPESTRIHRVEIPEEAHVAGKGERALREIFGLRTRFANAWREQVLSAGNQLLAEEDIDLIFVTMSPFEAADAVAELSARSGVPWVADLRDPWALDEFQIHRSRWHNALERDRMRKALSSASLVIMNTPEAAYRLRKAFPEFTTKSVVSVTNGFDAEDFAEDPGPVDNDVFTLVHSGFFHAEVGLVERRNHLQYKLLGRSVDGVHRLARSHYYLLEAIERWIEEDASIANSIRVVCAGVLSSVDHSMIQASSARSVFNCLGYLSHSECLKVVRTADLLFLPMHGMPIGARASIVPGKTYEYLASGRPILAALPEGDARDFVRMAGSGIFCYPDDVDGLLAGLKEQFARWRERKPIRQFNNPYLQRFERRSLTASLAEHLDTIKIQPRTNRTELLLAA